jgi:FkbM family methyltransferase
LNAIRQQIDLLRTPDLDLPSKLRYVRARIPGTKRSGKFTQLNFKSGLSARLRVGAADVYMFEEMYIKRLYFRLAESLPASAARILDLGANIGLSAMVLRQIYPGAEMICVEPDAGNFGLLQENAAQFPADRIHLVQAFAGSIDGAGYVRGSGGPESAYRLSREPQPGMPLPVWSVDTLLKHHHWDSFDLLKCDIEGTEAELFHAAQPWHERFSAMLIELHAPYLLPEFRRDLARLPGSWEITASEGHGAIVHCAARLTP